MQDLEILKSIKWKAIVIDECQYSGIANELERIKMLSTDMRLLLVRGQIKVFSHLWSWYFVFLHISIVFNVLLLRFRMQHLSTIISYPSLNLTVILTD